MGLVLAHLLALHEDGLGALDLLHAGDLGFELLQLAVGLAPLEPVGPADDALAKQQQAFDQMMQVRTEQEREANAIREFGMAQQKKENDFLTEFIRMILRCYQTK